MRVHQAFRFALDPSPRAERAIASHVGARRFAFNWGLARVKERLEARKPFPASAKKGRCRESVCFTTGAIRVDGKSHVVLPRIGRVRWRASVWPPPGSGPERGEEACGPCRRRRRECTGDAKRPWTGHKTRRKVGGPGGNGKSAARKRVRPTPPPGNGWMSGMVFYVLGNGRTGQATEVFGRWSRREAGLLASSNADSTAPSPC